MDLKDVIEFIDGKLICGDINQKINSVKIDSRKIKKGDTFIGINSGNNYYIDAFNNGANIVIVDSLNEIPNLKSTIVLVKDSIKALQKLSYLKRSKLNVFVIAITGSVGKTTTKDLVYIVLSKKYKVFKTDKNYNGQIGVPITILNMKAEEILLLEIGINEKGGMERLARIVRPNIVIFTNIGTSHIGNLGSRKNILKEKLKILKYIKDDGIIILNNDNDLLNKLKLTNYKIITYGINNKSDYNALNIKLGENKIEYCLNNISYKINLVGVSNIYNSLVAIIIGEIFSIDKINKALKNVKITSNRLEIINRNDIKIIDDTYNASYESIINALDTLKIVGKKRKIVVLGDILELGRYSKNIHKNIGKCINNIDILITVGKYSKYINKEANVNRKYHFNTVDEALEKLKFEIKKDDTILIKASHSMNFKYLVDNI